MDRITPDAAGGFRPNPFERSFRKGLSLWFEENPTNFARRWLVERYFLKKGIEDILEKYHQKLEEGERLDLFDAQVVKGMINEIVSSWGKSDEQSA